MKCILFHGDDTQSSRDALHELRKQAAGREIREVNGRSADLTQVIQALESASLFGGDVTVVIERLFATLGRKQSQVKAFAGVLSGKHADAEIIIWEDRELPPGTVKLLGPQLEVRLFKIPVAVFRFLDTLRPGGARQSLVLLSQVLERNAPEQVYSMLVKRVRHLIMVLDGAVPESAQAWQVRKLTQQAKLFTMKKLRDIHANLHRQETSLKSGTSPFTMKQLLEMAVADV